MRRGARVPKNVRITCLLGSTGTPAYALDPLPPSVVIGHLSGCALFSSQNHMPMLCLSRKTKHNSIYVSYRKDVRTCGHTGGFLLT
jgi:hypothetical protein